MQLFAKPVVGLLLCAALALFSGCASGPALERRITLQPGSKAAVGYLGESRLTLANASGLSEEEAGAARQKDSGLKIIPDELLQATLDVLGGTKFFDHAASEPTEGSSKQLIVVTPGKRYILTERNLGANSKAAAEAWAASLARFLMIYNRIDQFQPSKFTAEDLKNASNNLGNAPRP